MENEFLSKIKTIRSKNLRNFLRVYFYTYVHESHENNLLISRQLREYMQRRPPRVFPGLRPIQGFLCCTKAAAQDYLRAVHITHEIFVRRAKASNEQLGREQLTPMKRGQYEEVLRDVAQCFEHATKPLRTSSRDSIAEHSNLSKLRNALLKASELVANHSGVLTSDECARIIGEMASWLV
jgi:uncharacterized membrane protein